MNVIEYATPAAQCPVCGGKRRPEAPMCARCARGARGTSTPTPQATLGDLFAAPAEPPPPLAPHAGSPWRCRDHHEVRVDRRGRGCGQCAAECGTSRSRRTQAEPQEATQ